MQSGDGSETAGTGASAESPVDVARGSQTVLFTPSMTSPLAHLPADAFENLLVVSATRPPSKIERLARRRGATPERIGVVPISGSPIDYDGPLWTSSVVGPNDLGGVLSHAQDAMRYVKPGTGWLVLDNINVLLMYAPSSDVRQFLRSLTSKARTRRVNGIYAMVQGTIADGTYSRIRPLFDAERDRRDADSV